METEPNNSANDVPSSVAPEDIPHVREENHLVDGKAMSPESIALYRDPQRMREVGESGSQGNTLGRENQNPITTHSGLVESSEEDAIGSPDLVKS